MRALEHAIKDFLPEWLHPHNLARSRIIRRSRGSVISGPFVGQVYITDARDLIEPAMLMGIYECELHRFIERVLQNPPALFVDVGSSQGCYSIGFARRAPQVRNIAFELHEPSIEQFNRTAAANNCNDRIEFWGPCSPPRLQEAISSATSAFVLVDVEGYESTLLDPATVPSLAGATILVETHDHYVDGITAELQQRFADTHTIESIRMRARSAKDLPFIFCDRWTLGQVNEGRSRPDQQWLFMEPRT